jgi:DNA helicase HerA-like ATPase
MFSADDRPHIEIGTVYPTKDVRGALYIDAMLGKHFALLGSTGTGKSTSAALIMHRICDMAPEGHIVMIDPHGEYSAAFKGYGELFNVDNLAMPYWLMNFEEHCEVIITSSGADRQRDSDILAKCLLMARAKNRAAEGLTKLTVDSPIPYTLSDLSNAIQNEMGLLNKATDTAPYMRLKTKIDELKADPRYSFMFSGMLVADSMTTFISKIFRLPAKGKPISIVDVSGVPSDITSSWSPCFRASSSIMRSGPGTSSSGRCCWFARKRIATCLPTRLLPARPSARSSSGSPRRAVSTAFPWVSSRSGRQTWPKACFPSAAPSSACASTTNAIRCS